MNKIIYVTLGLLLSLVVVQSASAAVMVFVDNNADGIHDPVITINPGDPFSLNFRVDSGDTALFGFGMITNYSSIPPFAEATSAAFDASWQLTSGPDIDNTANTIETLANVGFVNPPVAGTNIGLYTADFISTGLIGNFTISNGAIGGTIDGFVDGDGNVIDDQIQFLDTEIRVVPLPAAAWLMLCGVGAFFRIGMRGKNISLTAR